jgi:hypothetical protein
VVERDRHLHRGEERVLCGELDQFFHVVASSDGSDVPWPKLEFVDPEKGTQQVDINLPEMYSKIISENCISLGGDRLIALTRELFLLAEAEFSCRWAKKRDGGKHLRTWELPK